MVSSIISACLGPSLAGEHLDLGNCKIYSLAKTFSCICGANFINYSSHVSILSIIVHIGSSIAKTPWTWNWLFQGSRLGWRYSCPYCPMNMHLNCRPIQMEVTVIHSKKLLSYNVTIILSSAYKQWHLVYICSVLESLSTNPKGIHHSEYTTGLS